MGLWAKAGLCLASSEQGQGCASLRAQRGSALMHSAASGTMARNEQLDVPQV